MVEKNDYRIITTTNENDTYIQFWPTMAQNWRNFCGMEKITLGFITEREDDDPLVIEMRKYGEVILIKPLNGIDNGVQAKVTRLYLSTQYPDDYCLIADIDMYVLNSDFVWDHWFSKIEENKLLAIGGNSGCYTGEHVGHFPMAFTTAKSNIWKEVINKENLSYEDLLNSWKGMNVFRAAESTSNKFGAFSDESLLRGLIGLWDNYNNRLAFNHPKVKHTQRDDWRGCIAVRRIDRIKWGIDINNLNNGYYIDSQPVRPFNNNIDKLKPILNYLGIEENNWILKNLKK
jgi:hypothetical protein